MIKLLGPFLILFSLHSHAGTSTTLMLRAVVPTQMKIEVKMGKSGPQGTVHFNSKRDLPKPKFTYKKHSTHYLVSITHP